MKNPGRTLAALGQKATDTVEEKGIPYVVSYAVTDFAIGKLADVGSRKLRGLDKADGLSKISTKIDDVTDVAKAVERIGDVAGVGGVEGGSNTIITPEMEEKIGQRMS